MIKAYSANTAKIGVDAALHDAAALKKAAAQFGE